MQSPFLYSAWSEKSCQSDSWWDSQWSRTQWSHQSFTSQLQFWDPQNNMAGATSQSEEGWENFLLICCLVNYLLKEQVEFMCANTNVCFVAWDIFKETAKHGINESLKWGLCCISWFRLKVSCRPVAITQKNWVNVKLQWSFFFLHNNAAFPNICLCECIVFLAHQW